MNKIPIYIINFNLRTWPEAMCEKILTFPNCYPVIVDNNSTSEFTRQWYKNCPYKVIRLNKNFGHTVVWTQKIYESEPGDFYGVTDPDLDISGLPEDTVEVLIRGLEKYRVGKAGVSLEIEDLPDASPLKAAVYNHERHFWTRRFDSEYFNSPIDTTFGIMSKSMGPNSHFIGGMRADRPYIAKHLPWYVTGNDDIDEELATYFQLADPNVSSWGKYFKEKAEEVLNVK